MSRDIHPHNARHEAAQAADCIVGNLIYANTHRCKAILWYLESGLQVPAALLVEINHGQPFNAVTKTLYRDRAMR